MVKRFLRATSHSVTLAALLIGGASLLSRLMGVVRDRLLSGTFGAGSELDVYYAAFRIPDLVYSLVVGGVVTAGFIPVFTSYLKGDASPEPGVNADARALADALLSALGVALVALAAVGFVAAPQLMRWIAPGFGPGQMGEAVALTRLMFVSPLLLGLSNVYGGILQTKRRFATYSLAPILYNVGIIAGTLLFARQYGVWGPAIGVVVGSLLHFSMQAYATGKAGYAFRPSRSLLHPGVKRIAALTLPRVFSLGAAQANILIVTSIASTLGTGSIAVFTLANNLQLFPTGIIGVSFAVAAFPAIAELAAVGKNDEFGMAVSRTLRNILFLIIPATVAMLLLRAQIVRVVLGTGRFDWADTIATADALAFFAVSLFAQAAWPLLARAFFALNDAVTPLWAAVGGVVVERIAAWKLVQLGMGTPGLALAFSMGSTFTAVWAWTGLRARIGPAIGEGALVKSVAKTSMAAVCMGAAMQGAKVGIAGMVDMQTGFGILVQGVGAGVVGLAAFALAAYALGSEEARSVYAMYTRRFVPAPVAGVRVEDGQLEA